MVTDQQRLKAWIEKHFKFHHFAESQISLAFARAFLEENLQMGSLYRDSYAYDPAREGAKWLFLAAEKKDPVAMYELGWRLIDGESELEQDVEAGEEWLRKAAAAGNTEAMWSLGSYYLDGEGLSRNKEKGIYWLKRAYQHGNLGALYEWIHRLSKGDGVDQNVAEAERLLRHLAEIDQIKAIKMLESNESVN
jgi:TPR repeat protein